MDTLVRSRPPIALAESTIPFTASTPSWSQQIGHTSGGVIASGDGSDCCIGPDGRPEPLRDSSPRGVTAVQLCGEILVPELTALDRMGQRVFESGGARGQGHTVQWQVLPRVPGERVGELTFTKLLALCTSRITISAGYTNRSASPLRWKRVAQTISGACGSCWPNEPDIRRTH